MSSGAAIAHTHICRAWSHSLERALSKSHRLHDEVCQSVPSWSGRRGRQRIAGRRACAPRNTKMADALGRSRDTEKQRREKPGAVTAIALIMFGFHRALDAAR